MRHFWERPPLPFADRHAAGLALAHAVHPQPGCIVLGIARGGVLVAGAIAQHWGLDLDVIVVRKVGHPLQPELAIGAVSVHGEAVTTEHAAAIPPALANSLFERARHEAQSLEQRLRGNTQPLPVGDRPVIVADDGIATAASMICALQSVRHRGASFVTAAAPVAPYDAAPALRPYCDELVVLVATHETPFAVGRFYLNFGEVSDDEVRATLANARAGKNKANPP